MSESLNLLNKEYEHILHSNLSDKQKTKEYAALMADMERIYNIPMLQKKEWEQENKSVIALYRKISMSRKL